MKRKTKRCRNCEKWKQEYSNEHHNYGQFINAASTLNANKDAMLDALCKAMERADEKIADLHRMGEARFLEKMSERRAFADFYHDVQLLRSQGAHALCGATWIRAGALEAACKKYAEATEKIR